MGHGNLTERPEWFAFADSVLKEGRPWIAEAAVPERTTACFINVRNGQLIASSDYHELK
jgi:hypothetical protein